VRLPTVRIREDKINLGSRKELRDPTTRFMRRASSCVLLAHVCSAMTNDVAVHTSQLGWKVFLTSDPFCWLHAPYLPLDLHFVVTLRLELSVCSIQEGKLTYVRCEIEIVIVGELQQTSAVA